MIFDSNLFLLIQLVMFASGVGLLAIYRFWSCLLSALMCLFGIGITTITTELQTVSNGMIVTEPLGLESTLFIASMYVIILVVNALALWDNF